MNEGRYKTLSFTRAQAGAAFALFLAVAVILPLVAVGGDEPTAPPDLDSAAQTFILARGSSAVEAASRPLLAAGATAVAPLLRAVRNDRSRQKVSVLLGRMGDASLEPLVEFLPDADLGSRAASVLLDLSGPSEGRHTPALLACLRRISAVKQACGMALVRSLSPRAGKQAAALAEALKDTDPEVRAYAVAGLAQLGPKAKPALEGLTAALKDPLPSVRWGAADALAGIGRPARSAAGALRALKQDVDPEVRRRAAAALEKIGG